jgi:hypothetical protein
MATSRSSVVSESTGQQGKAVWRGGAPTALLSEQALNTKLWRSHELPPKRLENFKQQPEHEQEDDNPN